MKLSYIQAIWYGQLIFKTLWTTTQNSQISTLLLPRSYFLNCDRKLSRVSWTTQGGPLQYRMWLLKNNNNQQCILEHLYLKLVLHHALNFKLSHRIFFSPPTPTKSCWVWNFFILKLVLKLLSYFNLKWSVQFQKFNRIFFEFFFQPSNRIFKNSNEFFPIEFLQPCML